jgi:hypothetical protein
MGGEACQLPLLLTQFAMNRADFLQLRDLPGKQISEDISFEESEDLRPNLEFRNVRIQNALGLDVRLNGTYRPGIPAVTLNVAVRGVGPICRIDVNGTIHEKLGRTHKHALRRESCPRKNLPFAERREDLESLSVRDIWERFCEEAGIVHSGDFNDPERMTS